MKIFMAITDSNIIPAFYHKTKIKLNVMISYSFSAWASVKGGPRV